MPNQENITGLELYALQIPGAFNKIPVMKLSDGVCATLATDLDLDEFNRFAETLLRLLVSGSLIIVDGEILLGEVIHVDRVNDLQIAYQLITTAQGNSLLKRWERGPVNTTITTYPADTIRRNMPIMELKLALESLTPRGDELVIRSAGVLIVDNGLGILVPVRSTIFRLQELMSVMEETTGEEALTWFITGYVGNINKLTSKTKSGGRFAPLPDGSTIQNASDSSFSDRLFKEVEMLLPLFLEATHNFVTIPGESGIARFLSMMGYVNKVKQLQRLLAYIGKSYGLTLTWDNASLEITTVDKSTSELTPQTVVTS